MTECSSYCVMDQQWDLEVIPHSIRFACRGKSLPEDIRKRLETVPGNSLSGAAYLWAARSRARLFCAGVKPGLSRTACPK